MDWHPCVTNQLAIALAGEMEMEVGGGGGAIEVFHAGDICLAEDRTGEGHMGVSRSGPLWSSWSSKQKNLGNGRRDS